MPPKISINKSFATKDAQDTQAAKDTQVVKDKVPNKIIPIEEEYKKLTQREQILQCPSMYIGSLEFQNIRDWIYNFTTNSMELGNITLPNAVVRLFYELFSNASDNVIRSRGQNIDPGVLEVSMNKKVISVRNEGVPIPVKMHAKEKMYIPELILGNLLTSSNYNDERNGIGMNGLGAKLANIFSKKFSVEVGDPYNEKHYYQEWEDNMSIRHEPIIKKYSGESFVKVSYELDFSRFELEEYPEEAFNLYARICYDASFSCHIPVKFNGLVFNEKSIQEYTSILFSDTSDKQFFIGYPYIVKSKEAKGTKEVKVDLEGKKESRINLHKNQTVTEICYINTPGNGIGISFVNGLMSRDGGNHVAAAYEAIADKIFEFVGQSKKDKSKKKASKKDGKKAKQGKPEIEKKKLTLEDIKKHVSVVVNLYVTNPKFNSQEKTYLVSPVLLFKTTNILENFRQWSLISYLLNELNNKNASMLNSIYDRKNGGKIKANKVDEANYAGGKHSLEASLFYVEGDSARSYPLKWRDEAENGNNYFGIFSGKGKLINAMTHPLESIKDNDEIKALVLTLGLKFSVDYTIPENFKTLRYGRLIILADADEDGKHIAGLILNFFYVYFKSLLVMGYIIILRTPVLRVTKGSQKYKFYSLSEYEEWAKTNKEYSDNPKSWHHDYFKGLGSSNTEHIIEDFHDPKFAGYYYDEEAPNAFNLTFGKSLANYRKQWIGQWTRTKNVESFNPLNISDFLNHEVVQYSICNLERSIPKMMDGLKPSQRKLLAYALKGIKGKPRVSEITSSIIKKYKYHHGDASVNGAIINMTQDFTGTNNLPYFEIAKGQFGTRSCGGKDAASPRYIHACSAWWLQYVYRKEDNGILIIQKDEGEDIEPKCFYPIIPMCLVNGFHGVASGWSTFGVNHCPLDIIKWLRCKIDDQKTEPIIPFYRDFYGQIEVSNKKPNKVIVNDIEESATESIEETTDETSDSDDEESNNTEYILEDKFIVEKNIGVNRVANNNTMKVITRGNIYETKNKSGKKKYIIDELPIGTWTYKYRDHLDSLIEKNIIQGYKSHSKANTCYFIITPKKGKKLNIDLLSLENSHALSNMYLLDVNNHPVKYETVEDILKDFYQQRLPLYSKRKELMLSQTEEKIKNQQDMLKLATLISSGKISVVDKSKADMKKDLEKNSLAEELADKISLYKMNKEGIQDFKDNIEKLQKQKKEIEETNIKDMWRNDLNEFEKAYRKHYKDEVSEFLGENGNIRILKRPSKGKNAKQTKGKKKSDESERDESDDESAGEESDDD